MSDPCREVVRIADEREAECRRLRYDLEQSWADHAETRAELAAARERVKALEEALRPFAENIPENWPDECVLTWESREDRRPGHEGEQYAVINYLIASAQGGPTIGDYRRAKAALAQPPAGGATNE